MGAYINPRNETKEEFLMREGHEIIWPEFPEWETRPEGTLPVVLMNNGFFTAAGIAYCKEELMAFTEPLDFRPKRFFYVAIEKLYPVSDLDGYLPKEETLT